MSEAKVQLVELEVKDYGGEVVASAKLEVTVRGETRVHDFQTDALLYHHEVDQFKTMQAALFEIQEMTQTEQLKWKIALNQDL